MEDVVDSQFHLMPPVIAKAVVKIQKKLTPLIKSEINDEYGSGFVPLDEVTDKAIELLSKEKIAVMQPLVTDDNDHLALRTMLVHESGVGFSTTTRLALPKPDPQGHGSAATYTRRYALMGILGMTAKNEDDDANKASGVSAKVQPEQLERIKSLLRHLKFPPDQIALEVRNIYTRDHATQAIINYEKLMSERMRNREAEEAAIEVDESGTHIDVSDGQNARLLEDRLIDLFTDGKIINKFVFKTTGKPFLSKCDEEELQMVDNTLSRLERGEPPALPHNYYAAGHPPEQVAAVAELEDEDQSDEGSAA